MIQAGGGSCNNDEKEVGTYTALSPNLCYKVLHRNSTILETKANEKEKEKNVHLSFKNGPNMLNCQFSEWMLHMKANISVNLYLSSSVGFRECSSAHFQV